MSTIVVREYLDASSRSPYARWFDRLNAVAAAKVATALYRLSQGNFSNVKGGGAGVFEIRIDFGPGYRVYFGKDGETHWIQVKQEQAMAPLTRDFKETVLSRAQRDAKFRQALFTEALNAYLAGDTATGKALLRDLINATIGFEELAQEVGKPSKSLHRMLAPRGNPNTENFFGIVSTLQKKTKVRLQVTAR